MPLWGYLLIGFVILALVLLTFRRNSPVVHHESSDYGGDFTLVLREAEGVMERLRDAVRNREERPVAMAAAAARSRVHAQIMALDRLDLPRDAADTEREVLAGMRDRLRQAMENYEWAARLAETTEVLENVGLLRAFETLAGAGDQLCAEARFDLVGISAGGSAPQSAQSHPPG
jgi:hypothetical protein